MNANRKRVDRLAERAGAIGRYIVAHDAAVTPATTEFDILVQPAVPQIIYGAEAPEIGSAAHDAMIEAMTDADAETTLATVTALIAKYQTGGEGNDHADK